MAASPVVSTNPCWGSHNPLRRARDRGRRPQGGRRLESPTVAAAAPQPAWSAGGTDLRLDAAVLRRAARVLLRLLVRPDRHLITFKVECGWTLDNYRNLNQSLYLDTVVRSVLLSLGATLGCLLIGFPVAYTLSRKQGRTQTLAAGRGDGPVLDELRRPHLRLGQSARRRRPARSTAPHAAAVERVARTSCTRRRRSRSASSTRTCR